MSKPIHSVERFFDRYSFVTFFLIAGLVLAWVIYSCFNAYVVATTPKSNYIDNSVPASFDAATAKQIDELHESDNPPNVVIKNDSGRINPFVE